MPVGAHWSVLLTVLLLADLLAERLLPAAAPGAGQPAYWVTALIVTMLFLLSLVAHELAHARIARRFGVQVEGITLWLLGGAATLSNEPPDPRADALIAGAGPALSTVLSGLCLGAAMLVDPIWLFGLPMAGLTWLAVVNFLLAAFNLIPAAPLDGGRLLRAWLWLRSGDRDRAAATAGTAGQVIGMALVGLGMVEMLTRSLIGGVWLAAVGAFVAGAAATERTQALVNGRLAGIRVGDVASQDPVLASGWWTVEAFLDHVVEHNVRHRVFPVVDFAGAPVGVLSLSDLLAVRSDAHHTTRVEDVARPLGSRTLALAGEPLTALLRRAPLRLGLDAVVVVHNRCLAGIVTQADIARTLELARLGRRPAVGSTHDRGKGPGSR